MKSVRSEKLIEFSLFSVFILITILLSGCGANQVGLVGKFPYQFQEAATYNNPYGCDTGYKEAVSREEYCSWLTDDRMNIDRRTGRTCAHDQRRATFDLNCAGYAWTAN